MFRGQGCFFASPPACSTGGCGPTLRYGTGPAAAAYVLLLRAPQRACHEGPSQMLNRTADERTVGNESQDETLAGGSPGCGARITTLQSRTLWRWQWPLFKFSLPSASSPWRPGCRPGGCRRVDQSSGHCCGWQNWSSVGSFWQSWPFPLSAGNKNTEIGCKMY